MKTKIFHSEIVNRQLCVQESEGLECRFRTECPCAGARPDSVLAGYDLSCSLKEADKHAASHLL